MGMGIIGIATRGLGCSHSCSSEFRPRSLLTSTAALTRSRFVQTAAQNVGLIFYHYKPIRWYSFHKGELRGGGLTLPTDTPGELLEH